MSRRAIDEQEVHREYQTVDRQNCLRLSKIGCILILVLVPAGMALDYIVYGAVPGLVWSLLKIRLLTDVATAVIFVLHFTPLAKRYPKQLTSLLVLLVNGGLCAMIAITEGPASPYYAGLNLVILAIGVLLPWTLRETLFVCVATLLMYLGACVVHGGLATVAVQSKILFNNVYFLVLTAIICCTASHFNSRARFEDFRLRYLLDERNRELAEIDRLKSEFFANISHELRTPLTLILAPIEDLLRDNEDFAPPALDLLQLVRQNGLRLLRLINDLLEIVRLDGGRLKLEVQIVDLAVFLPALVESVKHLASAKYLRLQVNGPRESLLVSADPARLEKVVLNILTNAIKFTPAEGTISVSWRREDERARIDVSDTGIGIPAHELPHIFTRLRQVDGSATRQYQGLGIGLALARELVEQHQGSLSATSEEGHGTTLTIRLPMATEDEGGHTPALGTNVETGDPIVRALRAADRAALVAINAHADSNATLPEVGSGEQTVLVVEDDPDIRRFIVNALATEHRVIQAADGVTGLELARRHRPDLAVLDVMLPRMSGLDVSRALKSEPNTADIKIIQLTARTDEAAKLEALDMGVDDFLPKPFSMVEVSTRIRNMLRTVALQRDLVRRNEELESTLHQLKIAESQLIQSEKMNALGNLAAGLLHEINNPLNFTLTAIYLARETLDPNDHDLVEIMNDIDDGMKRIRDIVIDLRAFAYPESAHGVGTIDLRAALDTAMRFAGRDLTAVKVDTDLEEPVLIRASASHIAQVLVNLLTNAARATAAVEGSSTPQVIVRSRREGSRLVVTVEDNGVGISPDHIDRVFDPFFTTKEVGEGMGLGLSVCHTIIRNHGGRITVDSQVGRGTQFRFDLPLAEDE